MAVKKNRGFAFLIYPESAPDYWLDLLEETHLRALVSPLHDKDVWTEADEARNAEHKAGTLKKPHYHCMILFDGPTTAKHALSMLEPLGVNYVEPVASVANMTRYFAHLDNEDKAKYEASEIQALNGAYVDLTRELSPEEKRIIKLKVLAWIRENSITEYADVVDYAMDAEPEWLDYVSTQTIFLTGYLRSVRGKYKAEAEAIQAANAAERKSRLEDSEAE